MAESENKYFARGILQILVPIAGVAIALTSLLLSMAGRKKELTCTYLGSERLVSVGSGGIDPDIKVDLRGKPLSSLTKMNFSLRNTGSVAIKGEDVKEPLVLNFPNDVQVLNAFVEKTVPPGFAFKVTSANSQVRCDFLLLNQSDEVDFSVYVYNSEPKLPTLGGRIVDLRQILNADDSERPNRPLPFVRSTAVRKTMYWLVLVINLLLAFASNVILVGAYVAFYRLLSWKKKWGASRAEIVGRFLKANPTFGRPEIAKHASDVNKEMLQKGIPAEPGSFFEGWGDVFTGTLVFGAITIFFILTALFVEGRPI